MNIQLNDGVIALERHQDLQLTDGGGTRVVCHGGGIWITQDHDTRDIVLAPGESFVLDRPGLAIVRATEQSKITLVEPAALRRGRMAGPLLRAWTAWTGRAETRSPRNPIPVA